YYLLHVHEAYAPLHEIERASDGQRRRGQDHRFHALEQPLAQDGRNVDRRGFEKHAASAPLPPEDEIGIEAFEDELERLTQLRGSAGEVVNLFGAVLEPDELRLEAHEAVQQRGVRPAIDLEETLTVVKSGASFGRRKQSPEKVGTLAKLAVCREHLGALQALEAQGCFRVARQLIDA